MINRNMPARGWSASGGKKYIFVLLLSIMTVMPLFSLAQGGGSIAPIDPCAIKTTRTLACIISDVTNLINTAIVPLIAAAAFAALIYGIALYIFQGGNEAKRKEGVKFITWSLAALFIMFAVWGIVNLLLNTFNLNLSAPSLPEVELPQL